MGRCFVKELMGLLGPLKRAREVCSDLEGCVSGFVLNHILPLLGGQQGGRFC